MVETTSEIANAGVDVDPERRPGVPMEVQPPRPVGASHWKRPDMQADPGYILKRKGLDELTPVFGTTLPPRGLSGLMRRAAYDIAQHRTSHWMLLLLADRVDAMDHRVRRIFPFVALAVVGGAVVAAAAVQSRRRANHGPLAWLR